MYNVWVRQDICSSTKSEMCDVCLKASELINDAIMYFGLIEADIMPKLALWAVCGHTWWGRTSTGSLPLRPMHDLDDLQSLSQSLQHPPPYRDTLPKQPIDGENIEILHQGEYGRTKWARGKVLWRST